MRKQLSDVLPWQQDGSLFVVGNAHPMAPLRSRNLGEQLLSVIYLVLNDKSWSIGECIPLLPATPFKAVFCKLKNCSTHAFLRDILIISSYAIGIQLWRQRFKECTYPVLKPCSQLYVELSQTKNICPKAGMNWVCADCLWWLTLSLWTLGAPQGDENDLL